MKGLTVSCALFSCLLLPLSASAAPTSVCVDVQEKSWIQRVEEVSSQESKLEETGPAPETLPSPPAEFVRPSPPKSIIALEPQPNEEALNPPFHDPESVLPAPVVTPPPPPPARRRGVVMGLDPAAYLKRLLEYEVTHHARYESVATGCGESLKVELYALERGWTVFARFSQFAREEKVDRVQLDELGALADRLALALLSDTNVQSTLTRENVLRADSQDDMRRVHSQAHFMLSLGTALRMGSLETAHGAGGAIEESFRVSSPLTLSVGSRNKFRGWALDPFARLQLGMGKYVPRAEEPGGHVDFGGSAALGLHFLRYANPPGVGSFYYGGGAHFEVARYAITRAGAAGRAGEHSGLWTGGLNMDLLLGYEFMRASSLHFFVQAEAALPAYTVDGRTRSGGIDNAYLPSVVAQVGLLL